MGDILMSWRHLVSSRIGLESSRLAPVSQQLNSTTVTSSLIARYRCLSTLVVSLLSCDLIIADSMIGMLLFLIKYPPVTYQLSSSCIYLYLYQFSLAPSSFHATASRNRTSNYCVVNSNCEMHLNYTTWRYGHGICGFCGARDLIDTK
jgi:hypothetical protein